FGGRSKATKSIPKLGARTANQVSFPEGVPGRGTSTANRPSPSVAPTSVTRPLLSIRNKLAAAAGLPAGVTARPPTVPFAAPGRWPAVCPAGGPRFFAPAGFAGSSPRPSTGGEEPLPAPTPAATPKPTTNTAARNSFSLVIALISRARAATAGGILPPTAA